MLEPDDQLDAIDEEHIRQVLATRGFQLIADRIRALREGHVLRLLTAEGDEVPRLQASIRTCDVVMGLPKRLIEEIRAFGGQ